MDFLCVGEATVDIIIRPVYQTGFQNTSQPVEQIQLGTGGDALNNSVILSKLGQSVAYVGRIGNDMFGEYVKQEGMRHGVDMSHAVVSKDTSQTKSVILINEEGNRQFYYYAGTSAQFSFEDVNLSILDNCKILQIGGTFHLPNFDGEGAAELLKAAQKRGVITCMDVTTDYTQRWNEVIKPCYPYLDYFLPSIEQASLIAGTENVPDIANFFRKRGVKNVAIKMGKNGSYCCGGDTAFYAGCYDVPVVETTGAGDSFVSGFLTGVLQGLDLVHCVQLATAVSSFTIQAVGATNGMQSLEKIEEFINLHKEGLKIQYDTK